MACSINYIQKSLFSETEKNRLEDIHVSIFTRAKKSGAFRVFDNKLYTLKNDYAKGTQFVAEINQEYNIPVARIEKVTPTQSFLNVNVLPLTVEKQGSIFTQSEISVKNIAPKKVVDLSRDLLEKMKVSYETVKDIYVNGVKLGANGVANLTQG